MGCAHLAQVWLTAGACLVRLSQPLSAPWSPPCPFVHAPCFGELCRGDPQVLFLNEPIWLVLSRANLRVRKPQLLLQGRLLLLPQELSQISCCPRTCLKSALAAPGPVPNLLLISQDLSQTSCCPKTCPNSAPAVPNLLLLLSAVILVRDALGQVSPGKMLMWQEEGAWLGECVHAAVHSCRTRWPGLPSPQKCPFLMPGVAQGQLGWAWLCMVRQGEIPAQKGLDRALRHRGDC